MNALGVVLPIGIFCGMGGGVLIMSSWKGNPLKRWLHVTLSAVSFRQDDFWAAAASSMYLAVSSQQRHSAINQHVIEDLSYPLYPRGMAKGEYRYIKLP